MGDELSTTSPSDGETVKLDDRWARSYWARRFGVTDEQLREAMAAVGPVAEDVRKYFQMPPEEAS